MAQFPHPEMQDQLSTAVETLNRDMELTFKPMFGGTCAYVQGRVFASLSDVGLALKLPPDAQAALLKEPDAKRLRYEPGAPESKTYVVVPPEINADPEALANWVAQSMEYALSLPAPKAKTRAAN